MYVSLSPVCLQYTTLTITITIMIAIMKSFFYIRYLRNTRGIEIFFALSNTRATKSLTTSLHLCHEYINAFHKNTKNFFIYARFLNTLKIVTPVDFRRVDVTKQSINFTPTSLRRKSINSKRFIAASLQGKSWIFLS